MLVRRSVGRRSGRRFGPLANLLFSDDFSSLSLRNAVDTARKNQIRNSALYIAGVGPLSDKKDPANDGSTPENWYHYKNQSALSVAITAVGTATVDGVSVRTATFRVSGNAAGGGEVWIHPEHEEALRATAGENWTLSGYARSESGGTGTTNITWMEMIIVSNSDAGVSAGNAVGAVFPIQSTLTRTSASLTVGADGNYVQVAWRFFHNAGAIDFYFTLAAPQVEKSATVTALDYRSSEGSGTWNTDYFNGATPTGADEEQYYVNVARDGTRLSGGNNPFSVASSVLSITGAPAAGGNPVFGRSFTSGMLTTRGSFAFKHGYIEIRTKLPLGGGWWPALWGLPLSQGGYAGLPELDYLETWTNAPNELHGNVHSYATGVHLAATMRHNPPSLTDDYHLYGCDWQANGLKWYFDRQLYNYSSASDWGTLIPPSDIENAPMYILLNLAMGGGGYGAFNNTGQAPGSMLVDYVRVWDAKPF